MTKLEGSAAVIATQSAATASHAKKQIAVTESSHHLAEQLDALSHTKGITGGRDFSELLALVAGESNFKTNAHNSATGATGPFQFVKSTWLSLIKEHGAELGLKSDLVDQIMTGAKGRPTIADPHVLKDVLSLRNDVALSTKMAAKYLDDNKASLSHRLHREPTGSELQMSFLLGPSGAARLIKAASHTPDVAAASVVPHAAAANHHLFYEKSGEPRSAVQAVAYLSQKFRGDKVKSAAYVKRVLSGVNHKIEA